VGFAVQPYAINTKAPATRSYYTLVDKMGNSKPLKDKKLKENILWEVQTFFVEEENFKTLFPTDVKDMNRETLEGFMTEAIRKKSRIQGVDTLAVRGAKLIRKTIQSLSLLKVEDMKKFPNWDKAQDAFTGKLT